MKLSQKHFYSRLKTRTLRCEDRSKNLASQEIFTAGRRHGTFRCEDRRKKLASQEGTLVSFDMLCRLDSLTTIITPNTRSIWPKEAFEGRSAFNFFKPRFDDVESQLFTSLSRLSDIELMKLSIYFSILTHEKSMYNHRV